MGVHMSAIELDHLVHHAIEEVTIVRDHDEPSTKARKPLLQPVHRSEVKVVRGLIKDQKITGVRKHPCECNSFRLTPRQFADVAIYERTETDPLHNCARLPSLTHRGQDTSWRKLRLLCKKTDTKALCPAHNSGIREKIAGHNPQQGRLPCAIDSHETNSIAIADRQREVAEELTLGKTGRNRIEIDKDGHSSTRLPASVEWLSQRASRRDRVDPPHLIHHRPSASSPKTSVVF
jgi:hypothetical protein